MKLRCFTHQFIFYPIFKHKNIKFNQCVSRFEKQFNLFFRSLVNDKLKTGLADRHKTRRAQICQVNIKVNVIVWLVEFFGCMTMAIDFLVVGSRSNAITGLLKILTMLVYFVALPCTFLVNCSAGINTIVDENWFVALARIFNPIQEKDKKTSPRAALNKNSAV